MSNPYESDELLQQYLVFHYAAADEQFPYAFGGQDALGFPQRCAEAVLNGLQLPARSRALDLGCSVGRSSFELAKVVDEVIGIDFSQAFIDAAQRLQLDGVHQATRLDGGTSTTKLTVRVDGPVDRSRVSFEQGDAQSIREDIGEFDLVIACNLICRLPEPMRLLNRLPELVKPGGALIDHDAFYLVGGVYATGELVGVNCPRFLCWPQACLRP